MRRFFAAVLLCVCLELVAVAGIMYIALNHADETEAEEVATHETIPPHRSDLYREWYLQSLWDIHRQTPDNRVLAALYGRSDTYIQNYIAPRTGEDFNAAKTRILSSLNPNPSDLEIHSVVTLEAYTVSRCRERYDGQCYLLDFTHWALSSEVLPALGATTSYSAVVAGDYNSAWAEWTIPRPSLRR